MASFPDYYAILGVDETATFDQIKTAYKRKSLQCHPDRIPSGTANEARRRAATVEFQAVADAYFELSDPSRRRAYDELRTANKSRWTDDSDESANFWSYFGGGSRSEAASDAEPEDFERPDPDHVFGNVFEELLRPEVHRVLPFWTWGGAASGAVLGFVSRTSSRHSAFGSVDAADRRAPPRLRPISPAQHSEPSQARSSARSGTPRANRSTPSSRTCRRRRRRASSRLWRSRSLA